MELVTIKELQDLLLRREIEIASRTITAYVERGWVKREKVDVSPNRDAMISYFRPDVVWTFDLIDYYRSHRQNNEEITYWIKRIEGVAKKEVDNNFSKASKEEERKRFEETCIRLQKECVIYLRLTEAMATMATTLDEQEKFLIEIAKDKPKTLTAITKILQGFKELSEELKEKEPSWKTVYIAEYTKDVVDILEKRLGKES